MNHNSYCNVMSNGAVVLLRPEYGTSTPLSPELLVQSEQRFKIVAQALWEHKQTHSRYVCPFT